MDRRIELDAKLCAIMQEFHDIPVNAEDTHVYFQPPSGYQIKYPCIVYERDKIQTKKANDSSYIFDTSYSVTYITRQVDCQDVIRAFLTGFEYCEHNRSFTNDNLYHEVFSLYY